MARTITKEELIAHKDTAINLLDQYLTSLINHSNPKIQSKADKLSYWLEDWVRFLEYEPQFSPRSLRRYKRGEIIKVHLGFNVGSEEGGLHYAVVIDKNNSLTSPTVTVVPLTSVKEDTNLDNLHRGSIHLGNELFSSMSLKISTLNMNLNAQITSAEELLDSSTEVPIEVFQQIYYQISEMKKTQALIARMRKEVLKMKKGSIALISQVRTISKIRIYDPKTNFDILSNIKLSNEKLDLIDAEIARLYTNITV